MKIRLYHGTSVESADAIAKHGFKDRVGAKKKNWDGKIISQRGYVYLTTAYAFYFAQNAAGNRDRASVLLVEVDMDDLFPDEDFIRQSGNVRARVPLSQYKHLADASLKCLGNVAARPESIRVIGRKDFWTSEMWQYSDPSISVHNYRLFGGYYRDLTDKWFRGEPYEHLSSHEYLINSIKNHE